MKLLRGPDQLENDRKVGRKQLTELSTLNRGSTDLEISDLDRVEEQSDFFEWTRLRQLRPDARMALSHPGGYLDIILRLNRHRAQLCHERGMEVAAEEAITSWYDTVYLPCVEIIRRNSLLGAFPGWTEAGLYVAITSYQDALMTETGLSPELDAAVAAYAARFGVARLNQDSLGSRLWTYLRSRLGKRRAA